MRNGSGKYVRKGLLPRPQYTQHNDLARQVNGARRDRWRGDTSGQMRASALAHALRAQTAGAGGRPGGSVMGARVFGMAGMVGGLATPAVTLYTAETEQFPLPLAAKTAVYIKPGRLVRGRRHYISMSRLDRIMHGNPDHLSRDATSILRDIKMRAIQNSQFSWAHSTITSTIPGSPGHSLTYALVTAGIVIVGMSQALRTNVSKGMHNLATTSVMAINGIALALTGLSAGYKIDAINPIPHNPYHVPISYAYFLSAIATNIGLGISMWREAAVARWKKVAFACISALSAGVSTTAIAIGAIVGNGTVHAAYEMTEALSYGVWAAMVGGVLVFHKRVFNGNGARQKSHSQ